MCDSENTKTEPIQAAGKLFGSAQNLKTTIHDWKSMEI